MYRRALAQMSENINAPRSADASHGRYHIGLDCSAERLSLYSYSACSATAGRITAVDFSPNTSPAPLVSRVGCVFVKRSQRVRGCVPLRKRRGRSLLSVRCGNLRNVDSEQDGTGFDSDCIELTDELKVTKMHEVNKKNEPFWQQDL
ncbi:hypothetical protein EVAR_22796_1 [Eumeta japonica]|uniref:Uncharacterized protein n=1 Tax=Eumeta variegata TaxID=151549 RepID=A0A4C1VET0_EUMVA|nr:hypothetical protein EVAR_22796_1 [Eumeta japonica]